MLVQITSLSDVNESRANIENDMMKQNEVLSSLEQRLAEMDENEAKRSEELAVSTPTSADSTSLPHSLTNCMTFLP